MQAQELDAVLYNRFEIEKAGIIPAFFMVILKFKGYHHRGTGTASLFFALPRPCLPGDL